MTIAFLPLVLGLVASHAPAAPAAWTGPAQLFVVNAASMQDILHQTRHNWNVTTDLLSDEDEVSFVRPVALQDADDQEPTGSFLTSSPVTYEASDLFRLIRDTEAPRPGAPLRIADAVRFAGYAATAGHRPRAVLLVLSGDERDQSLDDPATVRHLLAVLRVPLYVWSVGGGSRPGPTASAWEAEDISQTWSLAAAAIRLRQGLDAQRAARPDGRSGAHG